MSYIIGANSVLGYAYRSGGGTWSLEQVESAGGAPEGTSIALDGSGGVHIAYNHQTLGLRYAHRAPAGAWRRPIPRGEAPRWPWQ